MAVRDVNVDWLRKHVFVPAHRCAATPVLTALTLTEGTPNTLNTSTIVMKGIGVGSPILKDVNSLKVMGFELDAAGESVMDFLMLPFDMDPDFSLKFRVHFSGKSTTAADTYTWKGFYNNVLSAAAPADPATAFGTAFPATDVLSGTAYQIGRSSWGAIAASTWTRAQIEAGHIISLEFELDASDASLNSSEEAYFLGYEFSFIPLRTRGSGSRADNDAA